MKRAFGMLLILPFVFAACSSGPQVQVFNRPDIDTSKSRIIIFPMLLCQGNQISAAEAQNSNPIADALLAKSWAGPLGAGNTITIPKLAFDKIPMANDAVNVLIRVLDTTSVVEQTDVLNSFITTVGSQFGDGALAFALVFQDKDAYAQNKVVQLSLGLFDIQKMTWKWVTKNSYTGGMVPIPYEKVVQDLVDQSFEALKKQAGGLR